MKPKRSNCQGCAKKDAIIAELTARLQLLKNPSQRAMLAGRAIERGETEAKFGETFTDLVGERYNVSGRYVRDGLILIREAPDLAASVEAGEIKLKPALAKHYKAISYKPRPMHRSDHAKANAK